MDKDIAARLTTLEVEMREKWKAHDDKSDMIWREIKDDIHILCNKIDTLKKQRSSCMEEARAYTNKLVAISIGAPVTLFFLFRLFGEIVK
jgi:uncharacterized protein YaaQ